MSSDIIINNYDFKISVKVFPNLILKIIYLDYLSIL